jgi:hypothetical protein
MTPNRGSIEYTYSACLRTREVALPVILLAVIVPASADSYASIEGAVEVPHERLTGGRYHSPRGEFTLRIPDLAESGTIREVTELVGDVLVIFEDDTRMLLLKLG